MVCYFVRPQIKNAFDVVAILYVIQFKTLGNRAFSFFSFVETLST